MPTISVQKEKKIKKPNTFGALSLSYIIYHLDPSKVDFEIYVCYIETRSSRKNVTLIRFMHLSHNSVHFYYLYIQEKYTTHTNIMLTQKKNRSACGELEKKIIIVLGALMAHSPTTYFTALPASVMI